MSEELDQLDSWWARVEARADLSPHRRMLVDERGRELTFGAYRELSERLAAGLSARGIQAGDHVAWQFPNSLEAAVLAAALNRLGAVQSPLLHVFQAAEVEAAVAEVAPRLLVVPETWRGRDYATMARSVGERQGCEVLACPFGPASDDALALPLGDPADLAPYVPAPDEQRWVFYSSGTTGKPKGARHRDRAVLIGGDAQSRSLVLEPADVLPIAFPVAHIGGPMFIGTQMAVGFTIVLIPVFDPAESPLVMARHGATVLGSGLPFFNAYLAAQRAHGPDPLFPDLRVCVSGGGPLAVEMFAAVRDGLGARAITNSYGLSEFPVATEPDIADGQAILASTVGRPGPGVSVHIVGPDGVRLATELEGEVRLDGPQKLLGYVDPALDADAFDEYGYFRTGDLGVMGVDGRLRITGRIKDIIIRNGENVSAAEVEAALSGDPRLAECAVVGLPDPRTGERVCVFVVLADETADYDVSDALRRCQAAGLARFKAPERVEIVPALPRNSLGKVLKGSLRAALPTV